MGKHFFTKILTVIAVLAMVEALLMSGCGKSASQGAAAEEEPQVEEAGGEGYEDTDEDEYIEEDVNSSEEEEDGYIPAERISGILYICRDYAYENVSGSTINGMTFSGDLQVWCLDPETGETKLVRSFPIEHLENAIGGYEPWWIYTKHGFDENLERFAIDISQSDNIHHHVGWVDQEGNYTDVTELVTVDQGDFSGHIDQFDGCFGPGGYFYYYDGSWDNIRRVQVDDLRPEAVEEIDAHLSLRVDGSIHVRSNSYYDTSWKSMTDSRYMVDNTAWIDSQSYVGIQEYSYHQWTLKRISAADGSVTEIIPEIKDRWSYNPVVSPDGTQIAFLSSLQRSEDTHSYIFVVPAEGGSPRKLETDVWFPCEGINWGRMIGWW